MRKVKYDKYLGLGLPTVMGRSKKATFAGLKERIWKKMRDWKGALLSELQCSQGHSTGYPYIYHECL